MMVPVIAWRELSLQARRRETFIHRLLAGLLAVGIVVLLLVVGELQGSLRTIGKVMFGTLGWLAMVFCLFDGLRRTVDCLSEEKREGTLGLLLLTEVLSLDLVLGKFVVHAVSALYTLLAIIPALAMPFVLGGVTAGEFFRLVLTLGNTLFFSLALGMLISACSREEREVWGRGLSWLTGLVALPLLLYLIMRSAGAGQPFAWWNCWSPILPWLMNSEAAYQAQPSAFWSALGFTHLLAWLMLAASGAVMMWEWRRLAQGRSMPSPAPRWAWLRRGPAALAGLQQWLDDWTPAPPHWNWGQSRLDRFLQERRLPLAILLTVVAGGLAANLLLWISGGRNSATLWMAVLVFWLLHWLLRVWAAGLSCFTMARLRESGLLETLCVAPLARVELPLALMRACNTATRIPLAVLLVMEFLALVGLSLAKGSAPIIVTGWVIWGLALFVLLGDLYAVNGAGLWYGLTLRRPGAAIMRTVWIVLVLPLGLLLLAPFGLFFCGAGLPLMFIVKAAVIYGAMRTRFTEQFHQKAQQIYAAEKDAPRWWLRAFPAPAAAPPPEPGVPCVSCGRFIDFAPTCPHCGYRQPMVRR